MMKNRLKCWLTYIPPAVGVLFLAYFLVSLKTAIGQSPEVPVPVDDLPPQILYWTGLILLASPFILRLNQKARVLSILLLSAFLFLSYPLFSVYDLPYGRDSIYSYQLCEDIYDVGFWEAGGGTGQAIVYNHYPVMYIFIVVVSKATGLPLITSFMWGVGLFRLLTIPALIYLIFRGFIKDALFSVFLYITCPSLINFPHHGGFAIIFLLASLYTLIKLGNKETISLVVVNLFFTLMLVMTHHFAAYIWITWTLFLLISSRVLEGVKGRKINTTQYVYISGTYLLMFIVLFLSWSIYNAYMDIGYLMVNARNALMDILSPLRHELAPPSLGVSFSLHERILIYSSILVMASYVLYGAWVVWNILRKKIVHKDIPSILLVNFVYSSLLVMAASLLWPTSHFFILLRIFKFAYIGLIPVALIGIKTVYEKGHVFRAVVPLSLIILLAGSNLMLPGVNQRLYYIDRSTLSNENYLFLTPGVYEAAGWFKGNYGGGGVLGDGLVYDAVGGLGHADVRIFSENLSYEVYGSDNITGSHVEKLKNVSIRYIVTHRYMTRFPTLSVSGRVYTEKQISKFDGYLPVLFRNTEMTVYEVKPLPEKEVIGGDFIGGRILVLTKGSDTGSWRHKLFWGSKPLSNFRYDLLDVEKENLPDELRNYSLIILDSTLDNISLLNSSEKKALWGAIGDGSNALFLYLSTVSFWEPEFNASGGWGLSHEIRFSNSTQVFPASLVGDTGYVYDSESVNLSPDAMQFYFRIYKRLPEGFTPLINARVNGTDEWRPWLIHGAYGRGEIIAHTGRGDEVTGFRDQYHIGVGRLNPRIIYFLCRGCVQKTFGESLDVGVRIDDTGIPWGINDSVSEYHIRLLDDVAAVFPRSTHQVYIRNDSAFWLNSGLKEGLMRYIGDGRIHACLHDSGGCSDDYGSGFGYDAVYDRINLIYGRYKEFFNHTPYCWTTPQHCFDENTTRVLGELGILVDMENRSEAFVFNKSTELTWGRYCDPGGRVLDGSGFTRGYASYRDETDLRMEKLKIYNDYITMGYPYYLYEHHYSFYQSLDDFNKTMNLLRELDAGGLLKMHPQFLPAYAYKFLNVQNLSIIGQRVCGNKTMVLKLRNELPVRGAGVRVIGERIGSAYLDGRRQYFIRNGIDGTVVLNLQPGAHELILDLGEEADEPRIIWSDGGIVNASFDGRKFRFTTVSMPSMWTDVGLRWGEKEATFTYISPEESVDLVFSRDLNPQEVINCTWRIK